MRHGGYPAPGLPWPFFLLGVSRASQHGAQALYEQMTAQMFGLGLQHDELGAFRAFYEDVKARAYPGLPKDSAFAVKQSDD